ncbi:MAG: crotonase/enoyl-CoA hydratase family protein [Gammaproteobacteria bacterium]
MSNNYSCFNFEVQDNIGFITMCRGDALNTMTRLFWKELPQIIKQADKNSKARVLVLQAEGKHFSAGMDLANFSEGNKLDKKDPARLREAFYHELLELQDTFTALEKCRMPTIALIQGACVGGAIDMVAACDMRYCSEDAFFKIAEIDIGLAADVGTLQRLPKLMPFSHVKELAYTGRKFDAKEAEKLGLINRVFSSPEILAAEGKKLAEIIASKSPLVTRVIKKQLNFARDNKVDDALEYHAMWNAALISSRDMEAALSAHVSKSTADFDDLEELKSFWEKEGLVP